MKAIQRQFISAHFYSERKTALASEGIWQLQKPFDRLDIVWGSEHPGVYFGGAPPSQHFLHLYKINKIHIRWVFPWDLIDTSKETDVFYSADSPSSIHLVKLCDLFTKHLMDNT